MIYIDSTSAALQVGNDQIKTLYAVSIVILGVLAVPNFFVFCHVPLHNDTLIINVISHPKNDTLRK